MMAESASQPTSWADVVAELKYRERLLTPWTPRSLPSASKSFLYELLSQRVAVPNEDSKLSTITILRAALHDKLERPHVH